MLQPHDPQSRTPSPRALSLAIATSLILGASAVSAFAAGNDGASLRISRSTTIAHGDVVTGALPMNTPMHVEVALNLRNRDQLDRFAAAAAQPHAAVRIMSHDQLVAQHLPTQAQADQVAGYLTRMGFRNVAIAPNRMLVSADGDAAFARNAFATSFVQVRTRDGRIGFANSLDASIPGELRGIVKAVLGLQTVHQFHTYARPLLTRDGLHTMSIGGHNPVQFSSIYGGTGVTTTSGMTIGIITQGKLTKVVTDLNKFTTTNGLATVTTQTVNTNGTSTDQSGLGEWDLDSQDIVGMGGGAVGKLIFYNIPTLSTANLTADINTVVTANATKVINVSLGLCETDAQSDGSLAAQDALFQLAVVQGQTFSVSSGDSGADECGDGGITPSWPASSPNVVAVGGTTLDASSTTWAGETVWSGGGGSPSTIEARPGWQASVVAGTMRGVPDLSFDADPNSGAQIWVNGSLAQYGGTSLAAPIFTASWARILAGHPSLGFAAPNLYRALTAANYHDVTSGNNGGETAGVGWDFATGFGSFNLASVDATIAGLPTLSIPDVTITEGDSGTKMANFTVTMSAPSTVPVSFQFATAGGTATAGTDYVARAMTGRTIQPGLTTTTVGVTINGDTTAEPDETFFLNLSSPVGATLADSQGVATIQNDDGLSLPSLSVSDVTITEGQSGTKSATFVVTLSAPSASPVTFKYATADGTATAGSDYVARALIGRTIQPGLTTTTIGVTVDGDTTAEPDETFFLNLSNPIGASIADGQGTGTIQNDD